MRRLLLTSLATTLAAALAGCANTAPGPGATASEREELRRTCEARGGMLVPSGAATGRPALDDVCRIPEASNLPR